MDWLDELKNIREEDDRQRQKEIEDLDLSLLGKTQDDIAYQILKHAEAHNLLRRVNSVLLANKGVIEPMETTKYDYALALTWQGRVSDAKRPAKNSSDPQYFIVVSIRETSMYVK
ncbi:MAG: hypothetical protein KDJ65_05630 [Anaerolineae bacterium]|nr:hypothetical protein [Anaerolineae bacterium]